MKISSIVFKDDCQTLNRRIAKAHRHHNHHSPAFSSTNQSPVNHTVANNQNLSPEPMDGSDSPQLINNNQTNNNINNGSAAAVNGHKKSNYPAKSQTPNQLTPDPLDHHTMHDHALRQTGGGGTHHGHHGHQANQKINASNPNPYTYHQHQQQMVGSNNNTQPALHNNSSLPPFNIKYQRFNQNDNGQSNTILTGHNTNTQNGEGHLTNGVCGVTEGENEDPHTEERNWGPGTAVGESSPRHSQRLMSFSNQVLVSSFDKFGHVTAQNPTNQNTKIQTTPKSPGQDCHTQHHSNHNKNASITPHGQSGMGGPSAIGMISQSPTFTQKNLLIANNSEELPFPSNNHELVAVESTHSTQAAGCQRVSKFVNAHGNNPLNQYQTIQPVGESINVNVQILNSLKQGKAFPPNFNQPSNGQNSKNCQSLRFPDRALRNSTMHYAANNYLLESNSYTQNHNNNNNNNFTNSMQGNDNLCSSQQTTQNGGFKETAAGSGRFHGTSSNFKNHLQQENEILNNMDHNVGGSNRKQQTPHTNNNNNVKYLRSITLSTTPGDHNKLFTQPRHQSQQQTRRPNQRNLQRGQYQTLQPSYDPIQQQPQPQSQNMVLVFNSPSLFERYNKVIIQNFGKQHNLKVQASEVKSGTVNNNHIEALAKQMNEYAQPRRNARRMLNSQGVPRQVPREQRKFVRLRLTKNPAQGLIQPESKKNPAISSPRSHKTLSNGSQRVINVVNASTSQTSQAINVQQNLGNETELYHDTSAVHTQINLQGVMDSEAELQTKVDAKFIQRSMTSSAENATKVSELKPETLNIGQAGASPVINSTHLGNNTNDRTLEMNEHQMEGLTTPDEIGISGGDQADMNDIRGGAKNIVASQDEEDIEQQFGETSRLEQYKNEIVGGYQNQQSNIQHVTTPSDYTQIQKKARQYTSAGELSKNGSINTNQEPQIQNKNSVLGMNQTFPTPKRQASNQRSRVPSQNCNKTKTNAAAITQMSNHENLPHQLSQGTVHQTTSTRPANRSLLRNISRQQTKTSNQNTNTYMLTQPRKQSPNMITQQVSEDQLACMVQGRLIANLTPKNESCLLKRGGTGMHSQASGAGKSQGAVGTQLNLAALQNSTTMAMDSNQAYPNHHPGSPLPISSPSQIPDRNKLSQLNQNQDVDQLRSGTPSNQQHYLQYQYNHTKVVSQNRISNNSQNLKDSMLQPTLKLNYAPLQRTAGEYHHHHHHSHKHNSQNQNNNNLASANTNNTNGKQLSEEQQNYVSSQAGSFITRKSIMNKSAKRRHYIGSNAARGAGYGTLSPKDNPNKLEINVTPQISNAQHKNMHINDSERNNQDQGDIGQLTISHTYTEELEERNNTENGATRCKYHKNDKNHNTALNLSNNSSVRNKEDDTKAQNSAIEEQKLKQKKGKHLQNSESKNNEGVEGRDFGIDTASFFKNQTEEESNDSFGQLINASAGEMIQRPQSYNKTAITPNNLNLTQKMQKTQSRNLQAYRTMQQKNYFSNQNRKAEIMRFLTNPLNQKSDLNRMELLKVVSRGQRIICKSLAGHNPHVLNRNQAECLSNADLDMLQFQNRKLVAAKSQNKFQLNQEPPFPYQGLDQFGQQIIADINSGQADLASGSPIIHPAGTHQHYPIGGQQMNSQGSYPKASSGRSPEDSRYKNPDHCLDTPPGLVPDLPSPLTSKHGKNNFDLPITPDPQQIFCPKTETEYMTHTNVNNSLQTITDQRRSGTNYNITVRGNK